jgi:hypothetical protein
LWRRRNRAPTAAGARKGCKPIGRLAFPAQSAALKAAALRFKPLGNDSAAAKDKAPA